MDASHSIGTLSEPIDHELLFLLLPLARVCICVYKRDDIVVDILLLSALVVQRYGVGCQMLKVGFDVRLGTARDAYM